MIRPRSRIARPNSASLPKSLIGVVAVKLHLMTRFGLIVSVGHTLLFAVGAEAAAGWGQKSKTSQSGPRPCGLSPQALDSQRDRLALRPHGNDPVHPLR